jgi:hypothetical protein
METRIPFPGFYESWYDQEFDNLLEREAEYIFENKQLPFPEGTSKEDIQQLLFDHSKFGVYARYVAEAYAEAYNEWLNETLGFSVTLNYVELSSPKEYNFTTDRIFCQISHEDVHKIYRHVGRKALRAKAKQEFTSRDGFMSFYSPDIDDWGVSRTWDHNQLYCLLSALNSDDDEMDVGIYEDISEGLYTSFQAAIDWPAFEKDLKFFGLEEDDNMLFPHPGITDPVKYVEKYNELNHLKE